MDNEEETMKRARIFGGSYHVPNLMQHDETLVLLFNLSN